MLILNPFQIDRTWSFVLSSQSYCLPSLKLKVTLLTTQLSHFPLDFGYIEDITLWREDMNFIFEWQNNILRTSAASE